MKRVKFEGELKRRIQLSDQRLSALEYNYPSALVGDPKWAGDWQGRSILAQACLSLAGQENASIRLKALIDGLDNYTNEFGYFGEPFNGKIAVEQFFSGNSWFLRGLVESYGILKDANIKVRIKSIIEHLLIPSKEFYKNYPISKREQGGVSGNSLGDVLNGWQLSTDTGCAFIMLDGATAAYELLPSAELKALIEVMIEAFLSIDYLTVECQTHAFLSATRGIMRFAKRINNKRYLKEARKLFGLYATHGMTLNYANFNWFNRRNTWTEPCAVVDSLILACDLYETVGDPLYLRYVSRIYNNAIRSAQRSNGGAGCDLCLSESNNYLNISGYEAGFCCTMRLNEAWKKLTEFAYPIVSEEEVMIPFWGEFESDVLSTKISGNRFEINFKNNYSGKVTVYKPSRLVTNEKCDEYFVYLNAVDGKACFDFCKQTYTETVMGKTINFACDNLLSFKVDNNNIYNEKYIIDGVEFSPLADFSVMKNMDEEIKLSQTIMALKK